MAVKTYKRHSAKVINDKRWPALRLAAKRRDGFRCVKCNAVGRLEVDHIKPVRDTPELAFDLPRGGRAVHARERGWRPWCGEVAHSSRDLFGNGQ